MQDYITYVVRYARLSGPTLAVELPADRIKPWLIDTGRHSVGDLPVTISECVRLRNGRKDGDVTDQVVEYYQTQLSLTLAERAEATALEDPDSGLALWNAIRQARANGGTK